MLLKKNAKAWEFEDGRILLFFKNPSKCRACMVSRAVYKCDNIILGGEKLKDACERLGPYIPKTKIDKKWLVK